MEKENLETRIKDAILNMDKNVTAIYEILSDLSLKLCHVIKDRRSYYDMLEGNDYLK